MNSYYKVGDKVRKTSGDYKFSGTVVSVFAKKSGAVRYVVENDDGLLFIFNVSQLEIEPEIIKQDPRLPEGYFVCNYSDFAMNGMRFDISLLKKKGPYALLMPDGTAAMCSESNRPYPYDTIEEAVADAIFLYNTFWSKVNDSTTTSRP